MIGIFIFIGLVTYVIWSASRTHRKRTRVQESIKAQKLVEHYRAVRLAKEKKS